MWCGALSPSICASFHVKSHQCLPFTTIFTAIPYHTIPHIRSSPASRLRTDLTLTFGNANVLRLAHLKKKLHTANRLHDSLPWSPTSRRTRSHAQAQLSIDCFALWSLLALMDCRPLRSHAQYTCSWLAQLATARSQDQEARTAHPRSCRSSRLARHGRCPV